MKKLKKIAALGLVGVMTVTGLFACTKSPKEKVTDAFKTLGSAGAMAALSEELGITDVLDKTEGKAFTAGMELVLEDSDVEELAMLATGAVSASVAADVGKVLFELGLGYAASDLLSAQLYIDQKQVAVKVPELLDKVLYLDITGDVESKIKNSILLKEAGVTEADINAVIESFSTNLKAASGEEDELTSFILGFGEQTKAVRDFKDAMQVTETDKKTFKINGKERKCEGYEIVITKASMLELVEAVVDYYFSDEAKGLYKNYALNSEGNEITAEEFDMAMDSISEETKAELLAGIESAISDIEAEMYIYDGEIVSLEAAMTITDSTKSLGADFEIGIELECTGGDYSVYDNYELSIKMLGMSMLTVTKETTNSDDEYKAEWTLGGMAMMITASGVVTVNKETGDFAVSVVLGSGDEAINYSMDGAVKVEKKKAMTVQFDSMKLTVDNELMFEASGEWYIKSGAELEVPSGDKIDVFTDKQTEWDAFMEDIGGVILKFYELLGGLLY